VITPTSTRQFAIVAWLAVLGNFAASLWLSPGYSVNSLYVVAILLAIWVPDTKLAYRLAALSSFLIFSNALIVPPAVPLAAMVFSRGMITLCFWFTAFVVTSYRRSVTARIEAERALHQSEAKLRAHTALVQLGQMAAVVAHEVRNPLAGIRGAVQVMGRRLTPGSREQTIVKEVVTGIDSLNNIVDDLLLFARPRTPTLSRVPVIGFLRETLSLLAEDARFREMSIHVDSPDVMILADPDQLKLVLRNLLINSAQAVDGRGEIRIVVRVAEGWSEIRIADQGPGIPAPLREMVFDPFFTTRHRGTGLGLPTARQILDAHGGLLELVCPREGGTIAIVRLPAPEKQLRDRRPPDDLTALPANVRSALQ